jgi:hypothetical protein
MDKNSFNKLKDNIPDMGQFTRRYLSETLTVLALVVGAFSTWQGFFMGGPFLTFVFLIVGAVLGIFFPTQVDKGLKTVCKNLYKKNRVSEIVVGSITVAVALFIPFIYFGAIGLLAGSAYHYYTRFAQGQNK